MKVLDVQGIEVDSCPKCAGVFLDGDEGSVINVDTGALFGFGARPAGISKRLCPDHNSAMMTFCVRTSSGDIEVERAQCCGGVFLDAGEGNAIAETGAATSGSATLQSHATRCPACAAGLTLRIFHEVNVDECPACASFFLEVGEGELAGIDTEALFDDAPWGAPHIGPSELSCPKCQTKMALYQPALLGPTVDVHFAKCCGGVWMKRGDEVHIRGASRRAVGQRADAQYAAGEKVQPSVASRTRAELDASRVAVARHASAVVAHAQSRSLLSRIRSHQNR